MGNRLSDKKTVASAKEYYRINDLMFRYGYSRGHITNLVKAGSLPPPMVDRGVKIWPVEIIEAIDNQRKKTYYDTLRDQGFPVPESQAR